MSFPEIINPRHWLEKLIRQLLAHRIKSQQPAIALAPSPLLGNYLPRECGIATFTTDLCTALAAEYGEGRLFAIPVNDPDSSYDYPEQVRLELTQEDIASYERAADFLNFNSNDLVCLQHEYGIYGGAAGGYILALLRRLKMPLVTTLHTVLRQPDANQRIVLEEIAQLSDRLIVMSELAAQLLREVYAVPGGKIDVIPHGVPEMTFMDPNYFKDKFGTEGKSVLLTFGLLSPNKGIEKRDSGAAGDSGAASERCVYRLRSDASPYPEARRRALPRRVAGAGRAAWCFFHLILNNRFVSTEELIEHVGAADIYITPYRQEAQIVSGTLAIALGAGKAIISTPYWYAKELLAEKRGVIVPFEDPDAIAKSGRRIVRERCGAPCDAEAGVSALPWYNLAYDGTGLHGDLSAGTHRALVAAKGCPTGRRRPGTDRPDGPPAGSEHRSSVNHDRRHGHVAARNLLPAQYTRGLYGRRQRTGAHRVHSAG